MRGDDGQLSALAGRGSTFELARWLEHDGDGRPPPRSARARPSAATAGLHGARQGPALAVAESPSALRDDCARGVILVLKFPKPKGCIPPAPVIDIGDVAARGAHALTIDGGRVRVETVADARGDRPWAQGQRNEEGELELADEDWPVRGQASALIRCSGSAPISELVEGGAWHLGPREAPQCQCLVRQRLQFFS